VNGRRNTDRVATTEQAHADPDPLGCEIAIELLRRKWLVPILVELDKEPRRRQYLFATLKVSSGNLDNTLASMARWGVIERTLVPNGRTDSLALAITDLGRTLLSEVTRLSAWQHEHHEQLLANNHEWRQVHDVDHS